MVFPLVRRPVRSAIIAAVVVVVFLFLRTPGRHEIQSSLFNVQTGTRPHLSPEEASFLCRKHGFSPHRQPGRKVYDLFPFNVELDWLDIRLNTLAPFVDYFVIVEGKNTFTHLPKPAILQEHWDNFTAFHPQMLHYVVKDPVDSARSWDHEDFFRNALLYETFPHFESSATKANDGDVIIVSDVDEIIKPEAMILLRYCDFPKRLTLRSHFYYYSFQWLHRGEQWAHPQVTTFHGLDNTISPVDLRNGEGGPIWALLIWFRPLQRWWQKADLWSSAWHCSSCFPTIKDMRTKLESFSHTPWNTEANRDPQTIVTRVRNGQDLFARAGEDYDKIVGNNDVPTYILANREKYGYMLNRDGEDAAFKDYDSWF